MNPPAFLRRLGAGRSSFIVSLRPTLIFTDEVPPSAQPVTRALLGRAGCSTPAVIRSAALSDSAHIHNGEIDRG